MLALNTNQSNFLGSNVRKGECSSLCIQCICTKKEVFFVDNILCGFGKFTGSTILKFMSIQTSVGIHVAVCLGIWVLKVSLLI